MSDTLLRQALRGQPLTGAFIVDWHVHLGRWAASFLPEADEQMFAALDRVGVTMICVNGILCPSTREGNDRTADFARRHPNRVVPFASLNPFQHDLLDELKRCVETLGMKGVKVHSMVQGTHSPAITTEAFGWGRVWEYCAAHRLPVLAHGVVTDDDIRRHPETLFVLAHGVGSIERLRKLRECRNLHIDTCWTQTKAWSLPECARILGPERILWGTDAPLDDFAQRLGIVLDSGLPEADQRQILGLNAARLLGLRVP